MENYFLLAKWSLKSRDNCPKAPDWEAVHGHLALSGSDFSLAISPADPPPLNGLNEPLGNFFNEVHIPDKKQADFTGVISEPSCVAFDYTW